MNIKRLPEKIVQDCRQKLIQMRADILNRVRMAKLEFESLDKGGDEADLSMAVLAEQDFMASQMRLKEQLIEIELALSRIEKGTFGICEETEEYIEVERLKALPWTRVSIEGAEIREAMKRKFAR